MTRPSFVLHAPSLPRTTGHYPGSTEPLSDGVKLGDLTGLTALGVHYEVLPPGCRTSYPHAEADEDEFVFVLSGTPTLWLDGELHALSPGDFVGFKKGTGHAHCLLNDSATAATLLVGGERKAGCRVFYPLNPERNAAIGDRLWADGPRPALGPHDGRPARR